ncbi:hypothetical protein HJFPF1_12595 [Paramyrothecium foliicola]|nr:hypothetical protein HJFPF1_12595 [Paramyrothecium foliicola]
MPNYTTVVKVHRKPRGAHGKTAQSRLIPVPAVLAPVQATTSPAESSCGCAFIEMATANYQDEEATYTERAPTSQAQPRRLLPPRYKYRESQSVKHVGKDVLGRELKHHYDDRCIDPVTGKFVPLEVQSTNQTINGSGGTTWRRRHIKSIGPLTMRLSHWALSRLSGDDDAIVMFSSWETILEYLWKSLVLAVPMMFMAPFFRPSQGQLVNGGRYSPVPYRYYGRPKKSRNPKDDTMVESGDQTLSLPGDARGPRLPADAFSDTASMSTVQTEKTRKSGRERLERVLLPRRLCFLSDAPTQGMDPQTGIVYLQHHSTNVREWMRENNQSCPEYLFLAWNGRQFPYDDMESPQRLHELARHATQEAGLQCYWLSLNCMAGEDENEEELNLDVWRISDVIRGCKKLCVLLRTPQGNESVDSLLTEWGQSIWTFPELLLSPGKNLTTYHYNNGMQPVKHVTPKNQFSARCLATDDDRYQVRRLLDHYLGNLKLSDLELMTVALHCFSSRKTEGQFLPGDYSYALMGLLGHRPYVSQSDSAFLAFARLSLENYNSRLFERFVCLLPAEHGQAWHNTRDAYGAQLWDIEPSIQVAGIGVYNENVREPVPELYETEYFFQTTNGNTEEDQSTTISVNHMHRNVSSNARSVSGKERFTTETVEVAESESYDPYANSHSELRDDDVVILDGCHAATIYWDKFRPVWYSRQKSLPRSLLKYCLRLNFIPFIIGIVLAALGQPRPRTMFPTDNSAMAGVGALFLIYSILVYMAGPLIIRVVYGGKFWETQPWFFGFEGYLPIDEIESKIFGVSRGRLMWSPYASSPLSHHTIKDNRWVVPRDPCDDRATAKLVDDATHARPNDWRVFTIVDTYSMTATLIEAKRPPEALLICGSEGGMQRALGCSFDWTTSTFYKETVVRLETRVLERMDRIRRVRVGIQRNEKAAMICN